MSHPVQLQPDEEVIATIKRHPVHLWAREILIAVIVLFALFLWYRFGLPSEGAVRTIWNIIAIVAIVGGGVFGYSYWYRYNHDLWLITSQRLIDSQRSTPFSHNVSTADLINLQDISVRQRGIAQSVFQYGDVLCQTASASGNTFEFRGVADPQEVLDQIEKGRSNARRAMRGNGSQQATTNNAPSEDDAA